MKEKQKEKLMAAFKQFKSPDDFIKWYSRRAASIKASAWEKGWDHGFNSAKQIGSSEFYY